MSRVGIITAMQTEVEPLVRQWRSSPGEFDGRRYRFFETDEAVLVCGGIGYQAGRRAAEAVIARAQPALLIAAGLAGGLRPLWTMGKTLVAGAVIDELTGRRLMTAFGEGAVVSSREIAGLAKKRELAARFDADLVDMEGFAVGEVAQAHGLPFLAAKAVSDDVELELPPLQRFVDADGRFQAGRFTLHAALHPGWWPVIARLKRHSDRAAEALAGVLEDLIRQHAGKSSKRETAAVMQH
jgi:adenosylhomocysteine nucleosidase